jgi:hypothetical protein
MRETETELRARFKIEVTAAGLGLAADDYERLFAMWLEHRPEREALRAVQLEPDEEPLT